MSPSDRLTDLLLQCRRESFRGCCDTGRYRLPYRIWGVGEPLLFIHGLSDRGVSFVPLIAHLIDSWRCIIYDLPSGITDAARLGRIRHDDLAADAVALLDHLHIRRACVVGSSFGSTVALATLRRFPQRWRRGVLQGGFAHRRLKPAERRLVQLLGRLPGRMRHLPWRERVLAVADGPEFASSPPETWAFFVANAGACSIRGVAHRARLLDRLDLRPTLAEIPHPILMIGGDRDRIIRKPLELDTLARLPAARRVELAGCGHYPHYIRPAQCAAVLRAFLDE